MSLVVALHATKCGALVDALAPSRTADDLLPHIPVVVILAGTDVNVDACKSPGDTANFIRRVCSARAVVAFSPALREALHEVRHVKGRRTVHGLYRLQVTQSVPRCCGRAE